MLFQNILDLITSPTGNLIYHLVLAFSVISSFQAAWIAKQSLPSPQSKRLVFGLGMLLLGQVTLFVCSGLAWQKVIDAHRLFPPLDRAIILFSLVWIVWLWNFPKPARLGDLVTAFLNLGVIVLFVFTYTSWSAQTGEYFNNFSWMDWSWQIASLFVIITGMAVLLFSRPVAWGYGFAMLAVLLAGVVAHVVIAPTTGDLSGYLRLAQLAAFPLLAALLHRLPASSAAVVEEEERRRNAAPDSEQSASSAQIPFPRKQERRRYSTDPRTLHAWLELSETREPEKILSGMSKAIAHTMLSDLCFLVNGPNYGHIVLQSGYDLIREEEMQGTMLEQGQLPMLSNAIQRSRILRIVTTDSQPPDLNTLSDALGLKETGSLMFIPLTYAEKPQGGILFLSPYSNRQWSQDDQNYLSSELGIIAQILHQVQQGEAVPGSSALGENLRIEIENLRFENQKLLAEVNQVRQGAVPARQVAPEMDLTALVALQQEAQDQIANLQAENERLQSALRSQGISVLSPDEFSRLEVELRSTLQEIAQLQNQLAEANANNMLLEREVKLSGRGINEDREVITSIVQEIRQPMSSILGYTDLLLAESVGILGALQRKFLERVKASTARMHSMLNDLIRVTSMSEGPFEFLPQPVELASIIDSAVAETSTQLRDKNIALRVDLPQEMPQIYADQDAIQQIILHLLQNAGTATPQEGAVTIRARVQQDNEDEYLLLQIGDTGGGIQPDDLSKVFARRYRADLPLIQGLGDTGVGISIAKTLVEAHGGRIWVDSVAGQSTTFSVLLPVRPKTVEPSIE
jgi:signal transduction histidine kinase